MVAIQPGPLTSTSEIKRNVKHPDTFDADADTKPGPVVPEYTPNNGEAVEFPSYMNKKS
jgi:hypothetical protein